MITLPVHAAEPDFTTSSVTFDPMPAVAGSIVRYTVTVANTGGESSYTRIVVTLPHGYLIATSDDCATATPSDSRLTLYEGRAAAGMRKECGVTILPHPESAGTIATLAVEITTTPSGYLRLEARPTLVAPPNPDTVSLGPIGVTPAGLVTLAVLALGVIGAMGLARMTRHDREKMRASVGGWIAVVMSIGFLLYFASLARDDLRSYTDYRETFCLIVDSSIRAFKSSGKNSGSTYAPEFVVRYEAQGVETYSVASPPATSVRVGWIGSSQQTLERMAIGSSQPCWFDPNDVKKVLLDRGPGAAYVFALPPLLLLALGGWMLRGALRSREQPPGH
jgi:hypothetical protein